MTDQMEQLTRRLFMTLGGAAALGAGLPAVGGEALAQSLPKMSEQDRKNVEAVLAMSAAWKTGDPEKIAAHMHEQIAFRGSAENMKAPPMVGTATFVKAMKQFLGVTTVDMRVLDAFALHPVVITLHQQLFENKERGLHEDLYIGCFFMEDGKIREWNDYGIIPYAAPRAKGTPDARFIHLGGETVKARG
jgi:hypothetical protein